MKKLLFVIFSISLFNILFSLGTLRVESIKELPTTHTNLEVRDADGKFAPVLIVKTELKGLGFQNVSRPTKHAAEYNSGKHEYKFYMNDNQRVVEITHAEYKPLEVRLLADFNIDVKAQRVYELVLGFDEEVIQVPVVITCNQNGTNVYVDNQLIGKTENKMLTANISSGLRSIRVEKDGFASQNIQEEISMMNNSFNFSLVPAMPVAVIITSEPKGAIVYIDGLKFGETPAQSFFEEGTYPIRIEKENYETIEEQITITEPDTQKHYELIDIRSLLTVKTYPNATVKFGGNSFQGGLSDYKILPQVLQIIVEMPKADPIIRVISLKPKSIETLEIFPDVQTGVIQVMAIPLDAKIELNGDAGEYYSAISRKSFTDIPVGKYELIITSTDYKTHREFFQLSSDETISKQITLEESMLPQDMIYVQSGSFQMGSNEGESDEKPAHTITVSDFYIGKYEVTQKEWKEIMKSNPSHFIGDSLPVEKVSWLDAIEYCNKKSNEEGLDLCYTFIGNNVECDFLSNGYRLPTEAEWEYAAKGGYLSQNFNYSGSNKPKVVAWFFQNSGDMELNSVWELNKIRENNCRTHIVGLKKNNELGIFDMSGNVWEWCWDWYDVNYYGKSPKSNPKGANSGSSRVLRGGSWGYDANSCLLADRDGNDPSYSSSYYGFRLVRRP